MDSSWQALHTSSLSFFQFQISFWIIDRNPKNIKTNSKAWILIKVQCVVLMYLSQQAVQTYRKLFFPNFRLVFELGLLAKSRKIFKQTARFEYWLNFNMFHTVSMDVSQQDLQIQEKLFSNVGIIFWNNSGIVFMHAWVGRYLGWSAHVLVLMIIPQHCIGKSGMLVPLWFRWRTMQSPHPFSLLAIATTRILVATKFSCTYDISQSARTC